MNWDALSAIGQVCGVIVTGVAIYFAVKPPKAKLIYKSIKTLEGFKKNVIINVGHVQTRIVYFGLKLPRKNNCYITATSFLKDCKLPIIIQTGDYLDFNNYLMNDDNFISKKYKINISEIIYFQNEYGKVFYKKIPMKRRIIRWFWWTFSEYNYDFEKV